MSNTFRTNGTDYWHCTYIIVNEIYGIFYVGLHSFLKTECADPWKYDGTYYGSGGHLKEAMRKINHGWLPLEITSVHESRRVAQSQETHDIQHAKHNDESLCLNANFIWDNWKDRVYTHLESRYGQYMPTNMHKEARIHFMQFLDKQPNNLPATSEEGKELIDVLWQQERLNGRSWAYGLEERLPVKFMLKRKR